MDFVIAVTAPPNILLVKIPITILLKSLSKTLQMAQNHGKKFDATAAQLLWLKENLYSRCCEYTIHFSDLREYKGTKLLGDQEITNISKNVGS